MLTLIAPSGGGVGCLDAVMHNCRTSHRATAIRVATAIVILSTVPAGPAAAQADAGPAELRVAESDHRFDQDQPVDSSLLELWLASAGDHADHDHPPLARTAGVPTVTVELDGRSEMVILQPRDGNGSGVVSTELAIRSSNGGEWSEWALLHADEEEGPDRLPGGEGSGPDSVAGRGSVGPIWVGEGTDELEVVLLGGPATALGVEALDAPDQVTADEDGPGVSAKLTPSWGQRPPIRSNADWGSPGFQRQNSGCEDGPRYADNLRAMVVHHTVTTNNYSRDEVPKLLLGIHRFHTVTRGWCDVAYNFLVDRFGTIWEGRSGGIDRPVVGGHARGFNSNTFAVSLLGQHQGNIGRPAPARPTTAALAGVRALGAWKLRLHGIDPNGTTWLKNTAVGGVLKHPSNEYIEVPTIVGHRDLGETSCPGSYTVPIVPAMREEFTPRHSGTVPYVMEGVAGDDFGPKLLAVDRFGGLRPALGQGAPTNPPAAGAAATIAVGGTPTAGYVLGADGTLRPYGDAPAVAGQPGGSQPVDLIVRDSGKSGYVVTADGFLHAFGGRVVDRSSSGPAVAGDVTDDKIGYTVSADGRLHPVHNSPPATLNARPVGSVIDIVVWSDGTSGYVLTDIGEVIGFGRATNFGDVVPSAPVAVVAGPNRNGGWVLDTEGRWWPFGDERPVLPASTNRGVQAAVDAVLTGYDLTGSSYRKTSDWTYIYQVFERLGEGPPSAARIDHWSWKIDHLGTEALGDAIVRTPRFTDVIVDDLYARALGRTPDAAGQRYWSDLLNSGRLSVRKMGIYFYGSEELVRRSGSSERFVQVLYQELLHRSPDQAGLAYWVDRLERAGAKPAGVVAGFYDSLESRRDRVDALYRRLAGQSPPADVREEWAEALRSSDDLTLAARMIGSPTYYRLLTR